MKHTGYIVFGHGSTLESANDAVRAMAAKLSAEMAMNIVPAGSAATVETAFLESGKPDLRGAVDVLAGRGITHIVVIPYFLTLGMHLQRDLPRLVEAIRLAHPAIEIQVTPPLDGHPAMLDALLGRAREAAKELHASHTD
jgi:sirohydrochlorin ferrochelatase